MKPTGSRYSLELVEVHVSSRPRQPDRVHRVAVDGIKHISTALVAQGDDGRECQIVGSGIGHTRDTGLIAFLLQDFTQGKTLAQVGLALP